MRFGLHTRPLPRTAARGWSPPRASSIKQPVSNAATFVSSSAFLARATAPEVTMTTKTIKIPGPDHPISIERNSSRVVVTLAGKVIADTVDALTLREAQYPPVHYIPRKDVDLAALERTQHSTYCPYKGDASYYSIPAGGERSVNAIWKYEEPYEAVAAIRGYVAFYPDRVDSINERAAMS